MKFDAQDIRVFFSLVCVECQQFLLSRHTFIYNDSTFQNLVYDPELFLGAISVVNRAIHVRRLKY